MANIVGVQTVDGVYVINVDADPTTGGGTPAPLGSIALANNGAGTFTKTGALDANWSANPSAPIFGVTRYIYLVNDASDATKLGGTSNNVYTTFQTAYDSANTLQVLLGGLNRVVIMVGNTTSAVGNLVLSGASWNTLVNIVGIARERSVVGTITGAGAGFTVNPTIYNATVGNITSEGGISLTLNNSAVGALTTTSTTGASGNITIANSLNSTITSITSSAILGNVGTLTYSNCSNINTTGNITMTQTSTTTSFSVGALVLTTCDNCRFAGYTATMAFATSTGTVGGLDINNTNQNILFSGVITIQGYTNTTLTDSDVAVSNIICNNVTFNNHFLINARNIASNVSQTGGVISQVNINNCVFNNARNRIFYNATTNALINASYTIKNCQFNNSSGGLYSFVYNTTFDGMKVENCSVVNDNVGIAIDNSTSPVALLSGNPLIMNDVNGGAVIVNIVQDDLGFDEVVLTNVNVVFIDTFLTDGDATFNLINCNALFQLNSSSASITKSSKYNNCFGTIQSDATISIIVNSGRLDFNNASSSVGTFNITVYTATVNFYDVGVGITIAGALFTSNVIRQTGSTLTATLNNSWDESIV